MSGHSSHENVEGPGAAPWWRTRSGVVLCGFLLIGGFYLFTEHTAHVFGVLPFLLILACPLMHLFHHRGHSCQGNQASNTSIGNTPVTPRPDREKGAAP